MVAVSTVVPTPNITVCGSPSITVCGSPTYSTIPQRSRVLTRVHLGWEVLPFECMEPLMQYFQAAEFLQGVSRLAAVRRSSTNCMYDNRWLCFAHWAAEQGINPLCPTAALIVTVCI